jgi:xanthine dehydrogenase accessory factor
MDETLLKAIQMMRAEGMRGALGTIIETKGSTPRKAGSKMLVYADGRIIGTIGGGCAEAEVRTQALHAIDGNQSQTYRISMLNDAAAEEGMVCGGIMDVFIQVM